MRHVLQGLITCLLLLYLVLNVVQELQFVEYSEQLVFVKVLNIEVVGLHVLQYFGMHFGLLEVGQHFLSDTHWNYYINGIQKPVQQERRGRGVLLPYTHLHRKTHGLWHLLCTSFVLEILSFGAILSVATGSPAKFAIIYSIGNVLTLAATGFLIGFKRQIKKMSDDNRKIASIIFLGALAGTLISAIVFSSKLLVMMFLVIQIPAYIWYCASYIPFARDCIRSCLGKCFKSSVKKLEA